MHAATTTTSSGHILHPSIVREYDIRGIVGETLSAEDARAIGQMFATMVYESLRRDPVIILGRDGRLSSPELAQGFSEGMQHAGATVVDVGIGPTPQTYFALFHLQADACVMVTGSHNPPTHNGFKLMLGRQSFYGAHIRELAERLAHSHGREASGSYETKDISADYLTVLREGFQADACSVNAAWDPGNGAAGEIVARICDEALFAHHSALNTDIDGTFPNHHPDPSVAKNLEQLVGVVNQQSCDVGLALDGDGDRLGVVDDRGRMVSSDHLLLLCAQDVLATTPGATIIADVKTSQLVFEGIEKAGGKPLMWMTGHSHIKAKMKETSAAFAGEASGHIFFADRYYGFDDGVYAAIRLLNLLQRADKPLSELVDALPTYFSTPEMRIDVAEERKFAVIDEIRDRLKAQNTAFLDIDGVRVMTDEGWWLIRASNTQAAIIARAEAGSQTKLDALSAMLQDQLQQSGIVL